jgi:hypothetical protein
MDEESRMKTPEEIAAIEAAWEEVKEWIPPNIKDLPKEIARICGEMYALSLEDCEQFSKAMEGMGMRLDHPSPPSLLSQSLATEFFIFRRTLEAIAKDYGILTGGF